MRITIIAVGKIREAYLTQGIAEYLKRLRPFATVTILEVAEEPVPETLSPAEQEQTKAREADRIRKHLRDDMHVIALAITGKQYTSPQLAAHLESLTVAGHSHLAFIIGGSLGLPPTLPVNLELSFGLLTFPHQLMRLILVEQLYRVFKIMAGQPYHK